MKPILRNLYCILAFATPIFFNYFPEDPFEMNKITFVYLFTGIIAIIWGVKVWKEKKIDIIKSPLIILVLIFLLFNLASLIFSIHPYSSLVGNSYRFNGGILSLTAYLTLFLIFIETFHDDKKIFNDIVSSILLSSIFISLYGIYQTVLAQTLAIRITSTFGQPDYLGEYLALVLPLNFYCFFKEKILTKKTGFGVLFAINLVALISTGSRSAWLALAIAALLLAIILGRTIIKSTKKAPLKIAVLFVLCVLLVLPFANQIKSRINLYLFTETKNEQLLQGGFSLRLFAWASATQIFLHNPLFGTGPETMMYAMPQYIDKGINNHIEWGYRFDKAHNEFLDILANTGFFAFLFYILTIILALRLSVFNRKTESEQKILGVSLIAIIIANFFGFSSVAIALYFWLVLALIVINKEATVKTIKFPALYSFIPLFILILIILPFFYSWIRIYLASAAFAGGNPETAVELNPSIDRYHGTLAVQRLNEGNTESAVSEAEKAILANKLDADNYIVQAMVFESTDQTKTLSAYDRAMELEPTNPRFLLKKAQYLVKINQKDRAKESLEKALELKYNYPEAEEMLKSLNGG